jgi:hypothetical protein
MTVFASGYVVSRVYPDVVGVAHRLQPSSCGRRVAFNGAERTVYDGPFEETAELVAGFWLWKVKDWPGPGPSEIEIRSLYEVADFGDALTPEIAEAEDRIRKKLSDIYSL